MADYIYDGTFSGFLCCVYADYYSGRALSIAPKGAYQGNLFQEAIEIETDEEKAAKVYRAIEEKISTFDLRRIYRIFLSGAPEKEMVIMNYIRFGFVKGRKTWQYHGLPQVKEAEFLERKVSFEVHRLEGLLRFSLLENEILYGEIQPDHDILELIAPHFSDRYRNDPFIIHDLRRGKAVISAGGEWYISEFTREELPENHSGEAEYRRLWKKYFETAAIKERINPRCQKNFMPVRYWKNLTEMK